MYPPPSSSKSTAPDGGDADINPYESTAGTTRDFSSLGSQTHHPHPPHSPQHNPNFAGHYFSGDPSSIGFDSNASSSSSLFRHRSSPAGFYDQHLPTDPNGFPLGQPNGGYGGGERRPSRLKSELRFSGGSSSSHQENVALSHWKRKWRDVHVEHARSDDECYYDICFQNMIQGKKTIRNPIQRQRFKAKKGVKF